MVTEALRESARPIQTMFTIRGTTQALLTTFTRQLGAKTAHGNIFRCTIKPEIYTMTGQVDILYSTRPIVAHSQTSGTRESAAYPSRPCGLWTTCPSTHQSRSGTARSPRS